MRVLVVEDEERLADAVARGLTAEGFDVDVVHDGLDGLWRAREAPLRRDRPRHPAARHERLPGLPDAARGGRLDADPHAHRQGRRVRRGRGARHRRRRLPLEAVLVRRARRPAARAPAARRRAPTRRARRSATCTLDPATRDGAPRRRRRSTSRRASSRCSSRSCGAPGEVVPKLELLDEVWGADFDGRPQRRRGVRRLPARARSTRRSAAHDPHRARRRLPPRRGAGRRSREPRVRVGARAHHPRRHRGVRGRVRRRVDGCSSSACATR